MPRCIRTLVLVLALSSLGGCGAVGAAATPETAVQRAQRELQQLQIVGVRHFGDYAVVLYTGQQRKGAGGDVQRMLGYSFVARTASGWRAENSGAFGSTAPPDPAMKLSIGSGTTQTDTERRTIVYGQALDPAIVAVEATFDDGRTARDEVTNGVFALVMIGAKQACAVRAFDERGGEIKLPDQLASPIAPGC